MCVRMWLKIKATKMLKKNYEFKRVLTKGKKQTGEYLNIFFSKNNKNCNFLGLAISTKVRKGSSKK